MPLAAPWQVSDVFYIRNRDKRHPPPVSVYFPKQWGIGLAWPREVRMTVMLAAVGTVTIRGGVEMHRRDGQRRGLTFPRLRG